MMVHWKYEAHRCSAPPEPPGANIAHQPMWHNALQAEHSLARLVLEVAHEISRTGQGPLRKLFNANNVSPHQE